MRTQFRLAAIGLHTWICAGCILASPPSIAAEKLVRLTRGGEAVILPDRVGFRLGQVSPGAHNRTEITVAGTPDVLTKICCPKSPSECKPESKLECVTERQIGLCASRAEVRARYGRPREREDKKSGKITLTYLGIEFGLNKKGFVSKNCG